MSKEKATPKRSPQENPGINSTAPDDPLLGWYALADDARKRQFKGKGKRKARAAVVQAKRGGA